MTTNEDVVADGLPRGVTPPSGRGGRFLSDVIVELGFAERETVEQAFQASRAPGKKLGSTLVEMGIMSEHQLGRAIAERYRLDYLDLEKFDVDPEAAQVIGEKEMKRYEAAPVAFTEDGALVVAMVDPADWLAAEEIAQLTGRRVRRAVASATDIAQVIARVAEVRAGGEEYAGDAFEASGSAPARLTLRRVTNPLTGRTPAPPATGVSEPTAEAQTPAPGAFEPPPAEPPSSPALPAETIAESSPEASQSELDQARNELAHTRAAVSRLEAELTAARDHIETLRADVTWARQQIQQKDEREDRALAELRGHIEATQPGPTDPELPVSEECKGVLTLITDKVRTRSLLQSSLEGLGYRVVAFEDVLSAVAYAEADIHLLDSEAASDLRADLHRLEETAPVLLLMPPGSQVTPAFRQASAGFIAMVARVEEYALRLEIACASSAGRGYRIAAPSNGSRAGGGGDEVAEPSTPQVDPSAGR